VGVSLIKTAHEATMQKNRNEPYKGTISIKGIVFENDKVWLRKNERNEWELPGGKLDKGEQPEETVVRELYEELGFKTKTEVIIQASLYNIENNGKFLGNVIVLIYLCQLINKIGDFEHIGEAGKAYFDSFSKEEIIKLNMPQFYKDSIAKAYEIVEGNS
jgi:8-oxo-dGTP pyrophosphatase MutT (NUDIX family)